MSMSIITALLFEEGSLSDSRLHSRDGFGVAEFRR
jgi:hypothetical protein